MVLRELASRKAKVAGTIRTHWLVESVRSPHQPKVPATYLFDVADAANVAARLTSPTELDVYVNVSYNRSYEQSQCLA